MRRFFVKETGPVPSPVSVPPETPVSKACQLMDQYDLPALAVVDAEGMCGVLHAKAAIRHMDACGAPSEQIPVSDVVVRAPFEFLRSTKH